MRLAGCAWLDLQKNKAIHSFFLYARILIVGILGCVLLSASSLYIALRLGALPWTLFFAALMSFTFLRQPETGRMARINFAHTMMSAGSMVAGAIAFVLPAISLLGMRTQMSSLVITTVLGLIMGLISCWYLRSFCLDYLQLDYPIGQAVYQTLHAYQHPTKESFALFGSGIFAGIFTFLRDGLGYLPQTFLWGKISLSPMAFALGYLMKAGALWWGGTAITVHAIFSPILSNMITQQSHWSMDQIWKSLSLGMLISGGIMCIVKNLHKHRQLLYTTLRLFFLKKLISKPSIFFMVGLTVLAFFAALFTPLTLPQSLLLIPLILITNLISMILCGQTGINPLETFGIMIFLALSLFIKVFPIQGILIILCTAIASGLCGDLMNDFQVGRLSKTPPKIMFIGEMIGAFVGLALCLWLFFIFEKSMGPWGSTQLPIPQATAIATIINGWVIHEIFMIGLIIGTGVGLFTYGLLIALGIYLPLMISIPVGLGGLFFAITNKKLAQEKGTNMAGGLLVGEGLSATVLAIVHTFKTQSL
ncbi:MAG: OPT/YSL family transporter [Spirochaetia bacterium]